MGIHAEMLSTNVLAEVGRGLIVHSKGSRDRIKPKLEVSSGSTSWPSLQIGLDMSKVARIDARTINVIESAKCKPGHILRMLVQPRQVAS